MKSRNQIGCEIDFIGLVTLKVGDTWSVLPYKVQQRVLYIVELTMFLFYETIPSEGSLKNRIIFLLFVLPFYAYLPPSTARRY